MVRGADVGFWVETSQSERSTDLEREREGGWSKAESGVLQGVGTHTHRALN